MKDCICKEELKIKAKAKVKVKVKVNAKVKAKDKDKDKTIFLYFLICLIWFKKNKPIKCRLGYLYRYSSPKPQTPSPYNNIPLFFLISKFTNSISCGKKDLNS
jgi:hypothetical protein